MFWTFLIPSSTLTNNIDTIDSLLIKMPFRIIGNTHVLIVHWFCILPIASMFAYPLSPRLKSKTESCTELRLGPGCNLGFR